MYLYSVSQDFFCFVFTKGLFSLIFSDFMRLFRLYEMINPPYIKENHHKIHRLFISNLQLCNFICLCSSLVSIDFHLFAHLSMYVHMYPNLFSISVCSHLSQSLLFLCPYLSQSLPYCLYPSVHIYSRHFSIYFCIVNRTTIFCHLKAFR